MYQLSAFAQPAFWIIPPLCILLVLTLRVLWRWRNSALRYALLWATGALTGNSLIWSLQACNVPTLSWRYLGLVLALSVPVALLGARLPTTSAWQFVVLGFYAVASLPVLEQPWASPEWHVDGPRFLLLLMVIMIGWINYLPTRLGWLVSGLVWSASWQLLELSLRERTREFLLLVDAGIAGGVWWAAFFAVVLFWRSNRQGTFVWGSSGKTVSKTDGVPIDELLLINQMWREIRDGWGLVWAWRVQEMIHSAARHAQLRGELTWRGLRLPKCPPASASASPTYTPARQSGHEIGPSTVELSDDRQELLKWLRLMEAVVRRFVPPSYAAVGTVLSQFSSK